MHVLPKGFHRIRHYGLLASGNRAANIARARELLAMPPKQPLARVDSLHMPASENLHKSRHFPPVTLARPRHILEGSS